MRPERHRRLVVLVVMCVLLLVTSWLEFYLDNMVASHTPSLHPPSPGAKNAGKRKGMLHAEGVRGERGKGRKADYGGRPDDDDDDFDEFIDGETYFNTLKAKTRLLERSLSFNLNLHACLPRFICELHAQAPGAALTDFEKDVLDLFRNHVVLEGPGSPVYPYQLAAHMGQLCTGLDPSPCHSLYPSCPLSRSLLIDILRSVKSSKRMFY